MSKHISKYLHQQMDKQAGIAHSQKRTKIVATVGPACDTLEKLTALVTAGVNVFRLNFSHGTYDDKLKVIEYIRQINKTQPVNIAVLADLQGPKLRVGPDRGRTDRTERRSRYHLHYRKCNWYRRKSYVSYPHLVKDVQIGERIFLDDGKMEVAVKKILNDTDVLVSVTLGGILLPKKGVNLPDSELTMPSLTEKDIADLDFIIRPKPGLGWRSHLFARQ